ncbi:hypothetical protein FNH08_05990 [Streptomyces spongiae]|uniref:Uncharacterized protein n=1 Tax=Streptomyces spongiae TaxID=565072 RepID=A0A5N8XBD4_9ACTN|nr:hypothetical protein [Streptomyces spongiae]
MWSAILVSRVPKVRADLVPDDLSERVAPLLPSAPERRRRHPGRLRVPDRAALAGILAPTPLPSTGMPRPRAEPLAISATAARRWAEGRTVRPRRC